MEAPPHDPPQEEHVGQEAGTELDEEEEEYEDEQQASFDALVQQIRDPKNGFDVRNRKYHLKTYESVFVGSEAVDWLLQKASALAPAGSREAAILLGEELRQQGVFAHVAERDSPFQDANRFYRFSQRKRVVIVGGGFAGSKLAKKLQSKFDVTLIDNKPQFVCWPSIPSCTCAPSHLDKVTSPHSKYLKCTFVEGTVSDIEQNLVVLESGDKVPFEYLALCTGSRYNIMLQSTDHIQVVNPLLCAAIPEHYEALAQAKTVAVIGGGPVGVEIAGEIAHYFPDKKLSIVSATGLLERTCAGAQKNCQRFFEGFANVQLFLKDKVVSTEDPNYLLTSQGNKIEADIVFCCVGFSPNTDFLQHSSSSSSLLGTGCLTDRNLVRVEATLQVVGHPTIFALGDITDIQEEKLAQNAEKHADVVAANIKALETGKSLRSYRSSQRILIVSLGPKNALIVKGENVWVEGKLASKMKSLVEYKIMRDF
ncbi:Pyridine nucleotidedisulfide oxidoreductase family protein [Balamuthia mandrillaris]